MYQYIDKEYDGVIIKLPGFLIDINNLSEIINKFKCDLEESVKLSTFHPDYINSIHELENYKDKKEFIRSKLAIEKAEADRKREYRNKRIKRELIDWNWHEDTVELYYARVMFKDEEFDEYHFWPTGKSPKKKIIEEMNDNINKLSDDEYVKFLIDNSVFHYKDFIYGMHYRRVENTMYMDKHGHIKFRVELMNITYWINQNEFYKNIKIRFDQTNGYYFQIPGSKSEDIYLKDYKIADYKLIKL